MLTSINERVEWSSDGWDDRGHFTKDGECESPENAVVVCIRVAEEAIKALTNAEPVTPALIREWTNSIAKAETGTTPDKDEVDEVVDLLYACILDKNLSDYNTAVYEYMTGYRDWWFSCETDCYHEVEGLEDWDVE